MVIIVIHREKNEQNVGAVSDTSEKYTVDENRVPPPDGRTKMERRGGTR